MGELKAIRLKDNKMTVIVLLVLLVLLVTLLPLKHRVLVEAQPRSDLLIYCYTSQEEAFNALVDGEIDISASSLTGDQKTYVEANPNLQLTAYMENDMVEFDLNNAQTITDHPSSLNPMHIQEVRQAIAFVVDKDYVITSILNGFGGRIDAPLPYPQCRGWVDPSVVTYDWNGNGFIEPEEDQYIYSYSPDSAVALLANSGFSDTDGNGYLNYPSNPMWGSAEGIDTTAMPLKICINSGNYYMKEVGKYLYQQLEGNPSIPGDSTLALSPVWAQYGKVGGDFDTTDETWVQPSHILAPIVRRDKNYHIYTGGWSFSRFPTHLNDLFHSAFWLPWGTNYVTDYAHPEYDEILEAIECASSFDSAKEAAKSATFYHVSNCVNIPLWSRRNFQAWRGLAGVVNMQGVGIVNDYTFMNAYSVSGNTIYLGVVSPFQKLNVFYSGSDWERVCLDRVYTCLTQPNPYDVSITNPWVAQDWIVSTWIDPREYYSEKTCVTYYLRKDVGCALGCGPPFGGFFTAYDYEFTVWYNYAFSDSNVWNEFMDVHHLEVVDDYTVKVFFDDLNIFSQFSPVYPLLGPRQILLNQLCESASVVFSGADLVEITPGYFEYAFTTDSVVTTINMTVNGVPIDEGADFYIRSGYDTAYTRNVFVSMLSFAPTDVITINYYRAIPNGADGTFLGGNLGYHYFDTMWAYGTHSPIALTPELATFQINPYFFLETPPLGEVDWRWEFEGLIPPRKGYFRINILDVVKITGIYGLSGSGTYNPLYNPAADIDESDLGHIGILDLVKATSKYWSSFGHPPQLNLGAVDVTYTIVQAKWVNLMGAANVNYVPQDLYVQLDTNTGVITASIVPDCLYGKARGSFEKSGVTIRFEVILNIQRIWYFPNWLNNAYVFLIASGANDATCDWYSLVDATDINYISHLNQNVYLNWITGTVSASSIGGPRHYCFGKYRYLEPFASYTPYQAHFFISVG